jgi:hypothetical protein
LQVSAIPKLKPRGSRGSWEAEVTWPTGEIEMLPVGHEHWMQHDKSSRSYIYFDPYMKLNGTESTKSRRFITQLQHIKRLIIQKDKVIDRGDGQAPGFERLGYQCIYKIDNVEVLDGSGIKCICLSRIADC